MIWAKNEVTGIGRSEHIKVEEEGLELYAAMTTGFFYLLRVSEIEGLRTKDIRIEREGDTTFLNLHIKGSKLTNITSVAKRARGSGGVNFAP